VDQSIEQNSYLIVGLGNPGREYRNTRHNVGFLVLDRLAARLGETFSRLESKALVTKGNFRGQNLVLAKPQTYMNESGQSVGALMRFYKVPLQNFLVIYDDVDLPFGVLRIRPMGGTGGHKGMASIVERLGQDEFARLRVGIGRPPGKMAAATYVLRDFSPAEVEFLPPILDRAVDAVLTFCVDGLEKMMNIYNGSVTS
jgi:PTH1 family peptidyl-tRNA hydrolase